MKTLDEVIKAYEICIGYYCSDAEHDVCPYFGESDMGCMKEPEKDALHYLKAFRDAKDTLEREKDRYAEAVKNCERAENKYKRLCEETSQKLRNTSQITCPKCHSEFVILPESNDPLTWEQLKQMEGKPVWIEEFGKKYAISSWFIHNGTADGYDNDEILYLQPFATFTKHTLGKTWQAYRKERS